MSELTAPSAVRFEGSAMIRTVVVGVAAGFLSGLFGVGGGILVVPALVLVLGMDQRMAHGTSLASVLPIAVASLAGYAFADEVDWAVAAPLAAGAVSGAILGTRLLQVLPQRTLAYSFAGLLLVTALRLFVPIDATGRGDLGVVSVLLLVVVGAAAGIVAGLLGVGGGIVMVPLMVVALGMPPVVAKGTSVAVIVPTSIMGTWRNRKKKTAELRIAAIVGGAGVISAVLGTIVSRSLNDDLANVLFAVLLTLVSLKLLFDQRRTAGAH
jgi:uncharacterized membrane protein YfcA